MSLQCICLHSPTLTSISCFQHCLSRPVSQLSIIVLATINNQRIDEQCSVLIFPLETIAMVYITFSMMCSTSLQSTVNVTVHIIQQPKHYRVILAHPKCLALHNTCIYTYMYTAPCEKLYQYITHPNPCTCT